MARKLAAVASQSRPPLVVANGTEGEPASSKDKVLLARSPHLVLDGAATAARAVGAREAIIVCHWSVTDLVASALAERRAEGLDTVRLHLATAADRFVAGEASAVVQWLERGRPKPTRTPPRQSERGLHGRPTLVQNVETLAHLALIVRYGVGWFRALGTESEPGSTLVSLLGAVRRPGVYEIAIGTPVGEILETAGGAAAGGQAMLLGGYFGTWAEYGRAVERPFSAEGLKAVEASPGAGLVAVLPSDACGLVETARVARYLAFESAGQCGPCVFGLPAIASELEAIAEGRRRDLGRIRQLLEQVDGRGACSHPDGAVRLVRSALGVFSAEMDRHRRGRCCSPRATHVLPVPFPSP
jgi:NADH:ubiquinone oxidoreductase subunit F (NADH-binding)